MLEPPGLLGVQSNSGILNLMFLINIRNLKEREKERDRSICRRNSKYLHRDQEIYTEKTGSSFIRTRKSIQKDQEVFTEGTGSSSIGSNNLKRFSLQTIRLLLTEARLYIKTCPFLLYIQTVFCLPKLN